jgi:hypothetical protein
MSWEALATHGDTIDEVRAALLDDFDHRWLAIGRDMREDLLSQGLALPEVLNLVEQMRHVFRKQQVDLAPRIIDSMAASASPRH